MPQQQFQAFHPGFAIGRIAAIGIIIHFLRGGEFNLVHCIP